MAKTLELLEIFSATKYSASYINAKAGKTCIRCGNQQNPSGMRQRAWNTRALLCVRSVRTSASLEECSKSNLFRNPWPFDSIHPNPIEGPFLQIILLPFPDILLQ